MTRMQSKEHRKSLLWYILMSLIMFGFIFDFYFESFGIPTFVTSSRLSAIAISFMAIAKIITTKKAERKPYKGPPQKVLAQLLIFHVPILIYMFVLYVTIGVVGEDRHMFAVLLQTFVFRVIPIYAFYVCIDKLDEFMTVILIVVSVQTAIVWLCITDPSVKLIIDFMFNISDMYEDKIETYAGGLGCITSKGLLRYAVGEVACVYMYYKKNNIIYILLLLIFSLTGTMIARTGLLFAIVCFAFIFAYTLKRRMIKVSMTLMLSFLIAIGIISLALSSKESVRFLEDRLIRVTDLFEQSETASSIYDIGYFEEYMHGDEVAIPPISIETIMGTGVPSGKSGNGIYVNVDGGFFRLYVAYGLILAVFFYLYFLNRVLKVCFSFHKAEIRYTLLLMTSLIIIGELKEWNIYASCHVPIFFIMSMLAYKDKVLQLVSYKAK